MKTINAKILRITRTGYSYYGNPHHYLIMQDINGNIYEARTATNADCGYGIRNKGIGENAGFWDIAYHYTKKGTMMVDYME